MRIAFWRIDGFSRFWHSPAFSLGLVPEAGEEAMTRGIWAGLVLCAAGVGCSGPQYYTAPPDHLPAPENVGGSLVQIVDERPEWEKKPFTGVVCLYHLGKAHPDAWAALSEEADAVVAAMPQKPERVEVAVTSYRLVRSTESLKKFHDWGTGPNPNPALQTATQVQANRDERDQRLAADERDAHHEQRRPQTQLQPRTDRRTSWKWPWRRRTTRDDSSWITPTGPVARFRPRFV